MACVSLVTAMFRSVFSHGLRGVFAFAISLGAVCGGAGELRGQEHPEKPLLWKVEGNGLETPSYLFGTIHLGTGPLAKLHPAASAALDEADHVFTEVAFDPGTQMAMAASALRKDGMTLSESIGPELAAELGAELKRINPEFEIGPFDTLKTWAIAMTLQLLPSQLKGEKAVDLLIWETAAAAEKKLGGLEKPTDQIEIFEAFDEAGQIAMLAETLRIMRKDRAENRDSVADLIAAYVTGDPEKVQAEIEKSMQAMAEGEHKELGERLMKRLLEDRDVSMATTIGTLLAENPATGHFFAVGAGHLAGETSIRSHLTAKGYTISRISE